MVIDKWGVTLTREIMVTKECLFTKLFFIPETLRVFFFGYEKKTRGKKIKSHDSHIVANHIWASF